MKVENSNENVLIKNLLYLWIRDAKLEYDLDYIYEKIPFLKMKSIYSNKNIEETIERIMEEL